MIERLLPSQIALLTAYAAAMAGGQLLFKMAAMRGAADGPFGERIAGMLRLLARHLAPGGIVVITTGDFGSLVARLAGRHWRLMTPPQHLWFFSQESIRQMAASLGLTVEHLDHPWKIVPLSLIAFQLGRMLGLSPGPVQATSRIGLPVNLFDAMRVILRKPGP